MTMTIKEINIQIALGIFFFDEKIAWFNRDCHRLSCIHNPALTYYYNPNIFGAKERAQQYLIDKYSNDQ